MERRSFSKYEQETIRTIVMSAGDRADYLLVNAYNDIFYYTNVEYIDGKLHFYYKDSSEWNNPGGNTTLQVQKDIIIKTLLLKYLVDNRLIYLVTDSNVQNYSPNIQTANKKDTKYDLEVDLPRDIARFLSKTKQRVIVSEELKALVENDFKTPDDRLLEGINVQIKNLETQTTELEGQRQNTLKLVESAQTQTEETFKQTEKISEQTSQALKQTEEAQKQTAEAKKQTEEAQKQTLEAQKQSSEALRQSEEALKQTKEALKQTGEALKQTAEAKKQTAEAKIQTQESKEQTKEAKKQTIYSKWVLGLAIASLLCALATVWLTNRQTSNTIEHNQKSYEQQIVTDSISQLHIRSIDGNVSNIKQTTDSVILLQKQTKRLLNRQITNQLQK